MNPLHKRIDEYLTLRRSLGYKLREYDRCLREFVDYLEQRGSAKVRTALAMEYACSKAHEKSITWSLRLTIIRGFARYCAVEDPTTEVPSVRLLPCKPRRPCPKLLTEQQINQLMQASIRWETRSYFFAYTHYCLFGLLAVTGMRLGEVLRLTNEDVDLVKGLVIIRGTKFGKSRLIVLHSSTVRILRQYVRYRNRVVIRLRTETAIFFGTRRNTVRSNSSVSEYYRIVCDATGIRRLHEVGPRLHDLRHRFAVETLLKAYRGGADARLVLPALSTYLGHSHVRCTYWYLTNTPELMSTAGALVESRWEGRSL